MAVQVKTTINEEKTPEQSVESRFVSAYERNKGSQAASVREMLLAGYILRELGVCQQLVDYEKNGQFDGMSLQERRIAVAKLISLDLLESATGGAKNEPPREEKSGPQLGAWSGIGS